MGRRPLRRTLEDRLLHALEAPPQRLEAFLVGDHVQPVVTDRGEHHLRHGLGGERSPDERHRRRGAHRVVTQPSRDRKSTRLNSSHVRISYAVFCLKKKKKNKYILYSSTKKKKKQQNI